MQPYACIVISTVILFSFPLCIYVTLRSKMISMVNGFGLSSSPWNGLWMLIILHCVSPPWNKLWNVVIIQLTIKIKKIVLDLHDSCLHGIACFLYLFRSGYLDKYLAMYHCHCYNMLVRIEWSKWEFHL